MSIPRRRFLKFAAAGVALPAFVRSASAQAFPTRPITMIVPYTAGGPTDTVGRTVAERMRAELGQPIVLENVGGAGGSIGLGRLARSPADGYTIEVGNWGAHVCNGALYNLPYDLKTDFAPIVLCAVAPQMIVAKKSIPANNLKEFLAYLKEHPNPTQGNSGAGSPPHIAGLLFEKMTGIAGQSVSYRGASMAMQDLVAGQTDMMIADTTTAPPQIRAGTIKGYAITGPTRLPALPDLPTVDEAGLPGFYVSTWNALFAPKDTPKPIIDRLNAAAVVALADPAVRDRLVSMGQQVPPREQQTPEALGALVLADIEKWWPIIKAANIKVE